MSQSSVPVNLFKQGILQTHLRGHQDHVLIFFIIFNLTLAYICHLSGQEASFVGSLTRDTSFIWNTDVSSLNFKTCHFAYQGGSHVTVGILLISFVLLSVAVAVSTHLCVVCSAALCRSFKAMWLVGILPQQACTLNLINLMKKITDDNTWVPFGFPSPICLFVNCISCKSQVQVISLSCSV